VILRESNDVSDADAGGFDERNASMLKFLTALAENKTLFNRIFLLSDKNEYGEVLPSSFANICATAAALPLLNDMDSHFNEIMAAKIAEQGVFASAGFWQKPQSRTAENRELHKLAETMEKELAQGESTAAFSSTSVDNLSPIEPDHSEKIANNVTSAAAKPLRAWNLWGIKIKDAEILLYENEAKNFFEKNYSRRAKEPTPLENPEKMPLSEVSEKEKHLREAISKLTRVSVSLSDSLKQTESLQVKFPQSVDYVKDKIGECYALRFKLQSLSHEQARLKAEQSCLEAHLNYTRETIKSLKKLPISDPPEQPMGEAPIAISLLRNDGLIHESHVIKNAADEDCLLRVIGGFGLRDLSRRNAKTSSNTPKD
jgi:hypothetical protein